MARSIYHDYDAHGFKIREERCGRVTEFTYDALGRLDTRRQHGLVTHYTYDLADHILEESQEDDSGELLQLVQYRYDADGNRSVITRYIHDDPATENFTCDPFGRITLHTDPLRYPTATYYDESDGLKVTTIDPRGIAHTTSYDAYDRVSETKVDDGYYTLSLEQRRYDPCGNLLLQLHHRYANSNCQGIEQTRYSYTPRNRMASMVRAHGSAIAGGAALMAAGVALEIATFGGYTFAIGFHEAAGLAILAHGYAQTMHHSRDLELPKSLHFPLIPETWQQWPLLLNKEEKERETNPFAGPVEEDVVVIDPQGNAIPVREGNWLTGTSDGVWLQEREPDGTKKGRETGTRKDGGHKPSPVHTDPRSLQPHAHVPGVTNADGTPWLPIY